MVRAENRLYEFPAGTRVEWEAVTKDDYMLKLIPERGPGILAADLRFQSGPIQEHGVNGITNEALLEVLIDRTEKLNALFPCRENDRAIQHMKDALSWLNERTIRRRALGVEGTNVNHEDLYEASLVEIQNRRPAPESEAIGSGE